MSKEVGRSWHLSEGRRLLGAGQMRLLPRLGREVHAVRGHAGRHRSSQWRAPCRPGAQLAAAPRTEGANQGWRTACTGAGPTAGDLPPPPFPHPQSCHGRSVGAKCGHAMRTWPGLECLHCNARGALARRVLNLHLAERPCAPAEGKLRTSAGHRVGAALGARGSAARRGRSAAGVRQVCGRWSPQLQPTLAPRMRKYSKNISLISYQPR